MKNTIPSQKQKSIRVKKIPQRRKQLVRQQSDSMLVLNSYDGINWRSNLLVIPQEDIEEEQHGDVDVVQKSRVFDL